MYQNRNNEYEIISLFCGNLKNRFFLREISRKTNIPLKTVQTALKNLETNSILRSKIEGKNKYFFLNLDNISSKLMILHAEIYKTEKFIQQTLPVKTFINATKSNTPMLVFGSFAKYSNRKSSDFDMVILIKEDKGIPFHLLPYKIHKIVLEEESFIKALAAQETVIQEGVDNHIILNNHSFFINAIWDYYGKKPLGLN